VKTCNNGPIISITAAAALVAKRFIGVDGNLCGAGLKATGVSELATAIGEPCPVRIGGIAVVEVGGAITVTANEVPVKSDSTGRAVAATAFAAAAPVVDDTKLTIDTGATGVTSSAANGAIISAASGLLAAPVLSGSVLPEAISGWAIDVGTFAAGDFIRIKIA
jgi:hypothetical protein